jgi:hypothetical protein
MESAATIARNIGSAHPRVRPHFFAPLLRFLNADARYDAVFLGFQSLITLRHYTDPLHSEILEREKQNAQIASDNFHVVGGECDAQRFNTFCVN